MESQRSYISYTHWGQQRAWSRPQGSGMRHTPQRSIFESCVGRQIFLHASMPLNHPDVADDDGGTRVDGPRVLTAINDAFDHDPSIVRAPPPCPAAARRSGARPRAQNGRAPGVTLRGCANRLSGARMSLGCSWPTGLCRSRMRGLPRGKATRTTSGSMCSVLTL